MNNKEILTMYCQSVLNTPYKWGGNTALEGMDCSGFVQDALSTIGLDPNGDQTAHNLYEHFKNPLNGIQNILQFGSLLFFGTEDKIIHVAIALNNISMIESGGGNSKTNSLEDAIRDNAFVRIRPIQRRNDLVCAILPNKL